MYVCIYVTLGKRSVRVMQELVPRSYEVLRCKMSNLVEDVRMNNRPPFMPKDQFW